MWVWWIVGLIWLWWVDFGWWVWFGLGLGGFADLLVLGWCWFAGVDCD